VTTKLHLAITAEGHVIEGFLTGGNVSDVTVADSLFSDVFGCHVVLDMGYDSDRFRDVLRSQNNTPVIPGRKNRKIKIEYDKEIYKLRKRIEQLFGKLKENKRLAMRYDKSDGVFLTFIALATIMTLI
jgi:transposase